MKRKLQFLVLLLVTCLSVGNAGVVQPRFAKAACRVKTQVAAVNSVTVAAVPLAVAVGVPVAEVTPYYYSYSAYAPVSSSTVDVDALASKLADKLIAAGSSGHGGNAPQPAPPAPIQPDKIAPLSLVGQKCAQCHSGAEAKGKLSLENLSALDCSTRLKAIRAILSETMPQGGPRLTPDEAGKLLEELVGQ